MSKHAYDRYKQIRNEPIEALLMAAMAKGDIAYLRPLMAAFPDVYHELKARQMAPGGRLPTDSAEAEGSGREIKER